MRNALLLCIALLSGSVLSQAQTAEEVIAKHLAAIGGDKWNKLQSIKMEANVTAQSAPGMEIPLTIQIVRDKSARMDVSVMGMTQVTCVNGDGGWMINPFAGQMDPEPLTADQVTQLKEMTDIDGRLMGYKDKGYKVEYLGTEDVDGTDTHKIKLDKGNGNLEYVYIDKANFYEIKNTAVTKMDGKEVESTTVFSNFKTVEGMVFPSTMEQDNPMMGTAVTNFTNFTINPAFEEALFAMPKK